MPECQRQLQHQSIYVCVGARARAWARGRLRVWCVWIARMAHAIVLLGARQGRQGGTAHSRAARAVQNPAPRRRACAGRNKKKAAAQPSSRGANALARLIRSTMNGAAGKVLAAAAQRSSCARGGHTSAAAPGCHARREGVLAGVRVDVRRAILVGQLHLFLEAP